MPLKITCYADRRKHKSGRLCCILAEGFDGQVVYDAKKPQPGVGCFYGVTPRQRGLFMAVQNSGDDWYYVDNGYAPSAVKKYNNLPLEIFRITKNAAQCDGVTGPGNPMRRDIYMPEIKPWTNSGREVLVCVQSEWHHTVWGEPRNIWLDRTLAALAGHTDRPVIVRDKPLREPDTVPLRQALKTAWAVVTYNSRVAIEAVLAGVPAFVAVPCAASPMAHETLSLIEHPMRPDGRAEWAAILAANQWTALEIQSGKAWRELQERGS